MTVSVIDKGILNCWPWAFIKNSFKLSESIDCFQRVMPIVPDDCPLKHCRGGGGDK